MSVWIGELMIYYTPAMFDTTEENLEELFAPLYAKKETVEFQLNAYVTKFEEFKRINFPEMLVYEKKKEHDPKLIPDRIVLDQFKKIEDEPAVAEFRKIIVKLRREIRNIEMQIANEAANIKSMFSFTDLNYEIYVANLNKYYSNAMDFTEMMAIIFENEFNKKSIYYEVAGHRNLAIINMLYEKAPVKCKSIMMNIYQESKIVYILEDLILAEDYDLVDENGDQDKIQISAMAYAKYQKYLRGIK